MWNSKQQKVIEGLGKKDVVKLNFTPGKYGLPHISKFIPPTEEENGDASPVGDNTEQVVSKVRDKDKMQTISTSKSRMARKTDVKNDRVKPSKVVNESDNSIETDKFDRVNVDKSAINKNDRVNVILEFIKAHPGSRTNYISEELDRSTKTIQRGLDILKKEGKIEFIGVPKTGGYFVVVGQK